MDVLCFVKAIFLLLPVVRVRNVGVVGAWKARGVNADTVVIDIDDMPTDTSMMVPYHPTNVVASRIRMVQQ